MTQIQYLCTKFARLVLTLALVGSSFAPSMSASVAHATGDTVYNDATQIDLTGDDVTSSELDLPFPITYYDQTFNHYRLSTNGYLDFLNDSHDYVGYSVQPYNQDLYSYHSKNIYVKTLGSAPNRQFVVEWSNTGLCCSTSVPIMTFQVIFTETTNTIQFQYLYNISGHDGDGTYGNTRLVTPVGNAATFNPEHEPAITPRKAVLFTPTDTANYSIDDTVSYDPIYLRVANQPEVPTVTAPADGATEVTSLSWNASANAANYIVYFSKTPEFTRNSTIASGEVAGTTINLSDFDIAPQTHYYWFVQAVNDDGSESSTIRTLTTAPAVGHNITNCDDLQAIDHTGTIYDTFNLTQDIDCTGVDFVPLYQNADNYFRGTFNGHNHTISNLTIDNDSGNAGLFSETENGAVIENVTLNGGSVSANDAAGALVGYAQDTTVSNVHANLDISATSNCIGGLIGEIYNDQGESSVVRDSSTSGSVTGYTYAGGLVGFVDNYEGSTTIQRSSSAGTVQQSDDGEYQYGGLVGEFDVYTEDAGFDATGLIEDSYSHSDVTGGHMVGGLVGNIEVDNDDAAAQATMTVRRSYASGTVSAIELSGGLIGYAYTRDAVGNETTISDNFAAAPLAPQGEAQYYAGFIGNASGALPNFSNNLFADSLTDFNGYCASITIDSGCDSVSDAADFTNSTTNAPFAVDSTQVWDFDNVWQTVTDNYPILKTAAYSESATVNSAETDEAVSIEQSGCNNITSATSNKESGLAVTDPAYNYPAGFIGFHLTGCPEGGTATVTVTFTGNFDIAAVVARKFNATNNSYATITDATKTATTLDGHPALQVSYTVTDGGVLDQDGAANGIIVDPIGLAVQSLGVPNTGFGGLSL